VRVELSDEQWVDMTGPEEVLDGDRKAANKVVKVVVTDDGQAIMDSDFEDQMRDALLIRFITDWSYPLPIPRRDKTSLDKLTVKQGKELREALDPHMAIIREGGGPGARGSVPTSA
jgi:hypothetical protein